VEKGRRSAARTEPDDGAVSHKLKSPTGKASQHIALRPGHGSLLRHPVKFQALQTLYNLIHLCL
jgi:hypothetical protein